MMYFEMLWSEANENTIVYNNRHTVNMYWWCDWQHVVYGHEERILQLTTECSTGWHQNHSVWLCVCRHQAV